VGQAFQPDRRPRSLVSMFATSCQAGKPDVRSNIRRIAIEIFLDDAVFGGEDSCDAVFEFAFKFFGRPAAAETAEDDALVWRFGGSTGALSGSRASVSAGSALLDSRRT